MQTIMYPSQFLRQIRPFRCWITTVNKYEALYAEGFDRFEKPLLWALSWNPIKEKAQALDIDPDKDHLVIIFVGRQRRDDPTFLYFYMKGEKPTQDQAIRFLMDFIYTQSTPLNPDDTFDFLQAVPDDKSYTVHELRHMRTNMYYANKLHSSFNSMFCFDLPAYSEVANVVTTKAGVQQKQIRRTSINKPIKIIELFKKYCDEPTGN